VRILEQYDVVFLGGGPAGYQGAIRAAQLGKRVAVIENRDLGGVCLNRGCIPTKTIKASIDVLNKARQAKSYGIIIPEASPDLQAIIARKDKVVGLLRGGISQLFKSRRIRLYRGEGRFVSPREIQIASQEGEIYIGFEKAIIATGSRPFIPEKFQSYSQFYMDTDDILDIKEIPSSLAIIGAGAVGVEMASIMASLGSQVTLIDLQDKILPGEDMEMTAYLTRMLKRQKIKIITGASVLDIDNEAGITSKLSNGDEIAVEALLMATGRKANTENIGLDTIGLSTENEFIKVNENMETAVAGIYAAGDVVGGWLLAHVAFAEGITAAEHAAGLAARMDYRVIPRCIFSVPEYAAVGLSEQETMPDQHSQSFRFQLKSLGMAQALGEWEGLIKIIVNQNSGDILGAHIIGAHASDLIAEFALAMRNGVKVQGIVDTIHTHPTMAEAVLEIAQAALGQAIHIIPNP
jgi:dihydrolipoamide dehydrogenase